MVCSNVGSNVGCNVGSNVGSNVARSERGVLMVFCRIAFRCSQVFSVSGTHTCAYVCIQFFSRGGMNVQCINTARTSGFLLCFLFLF